jgi:hypothetical protein
VSGVKAWISTCARKRVLALADVLRDPTVDPDDVRRVVDEVLSRPEYADAEPSLFQRAFDRFFEWLGDRLDGTLPAEVPEQIGMIVLAVLGLVAAWLIIKNLARVRRNRRQPVAIGEPTGRSPEDWLADAAAHEAQGEFRAALRCHYRATVALLAAEGFLDEIAGTTTGEYRAALAEVLPAASEPFGELTTEFERAWYGRARVERADLDRAVAAAERVRRDVPVGASA